jgi:hypothetical protein
VDVGPGDLTRPSAGGGGFGDPLERDPEAVVEDVADGYVTLERAGWLEGGPGALGGLSAQPHATARESNSAANEAPSPFMLSRVDLTRRRHR